MATKEPIPMTLLSGFLGSGKTCTLKHLLENTDGVKIGVIVNDVASVNIDAKLVAGKSTNGIVELQNGCACCSLADELLTSVDSLLEQRKDLDALVVELSGVADPVAIKSNWKMAKLANHPATKKTDVTKVVTLVDACTFGMDWMTYDTAAQRRGWTEDGDDCTGQRKVTELLAEQVESADLVLVNKVDLATDEEVEVSSTVVRGLNDKATLKQVEFGKIDPKVVLEDLIEVHVAETHDHAHDHGHDPASEDAACKDPDCTDHSHSHSHDDEAVCEEPDCTDTSHSHSHSHATSMDQLEIANFVYKRSIPFNAKRLMDLLNQWPVPIKENLDFKLMQQAEEGYAIDGDSDATNPFVGVLRSKGFAWIAPNKWMGANDDAFRHDTAMYWSHAGKHFGISSAGKWWGTIEKDEIKQFFPDDEKEYNRILDEDFVSEEFGDRRQELVFIGTGISEEEITKALDGCLLMDHEMKRYRQDVRNYDQMMLNMKSAGLFEEGGMNQMDPNANW